MLTDVFEIARPMVEAAMAEVDETAPPDANREVAELTIYMSSVLNAWLMRRTGATSGTLQMGDIILEIHEGLAGLIANAAAVARIQDPETGHAISHARQAMAMMFEVGPLAVSKAIQIDHGDMDLNQSYELGPDGRLRLETCDVMAMLKAGRA